MEKTGNNCGTSQKCLANQNDSKNASVTPGGHKEPRATSKEEQASLPSVIGIRGRAVRQTVLTNNTNTPQRHSDGPQDFGENNTKGLSPHTCGTTQHVRKRTSYPQLHMVLFVLIDGTINCALCKNILLSVKLRHTTITHGHV